MYSPFWFRDMIKLSFSIIGLFQFLFVVYILVLGSFLFLAETLHMKLVDAFLSTLFSKKLLRIFVENNVFVLYSRHCYCNKCCIGIQYCFQKVLAKKNFMLSGLSNVVPGFYLVFLKYSSIIVLLRRSGSVRFFFFCPYNKQFGKFH